MGGVIHERITKRVQIHERDKSKDGTHVDWWIYEESDPQNYFKEVKENE